MSKKTVTQLKTERTSTYPVGVPAGTKVANEYNFWENVLDSLAHQDDITGTKTFTTAGTGAAYTVTDAEVTANSFLDGKAFFLIPHADVTGAATIQFNALAPLSIKLISKEGKESVLSTEIKANVVYIITKEAGIDEIYIRKENEKRKLKANSISASFFDSNDWNISDYSEIDGVTFLLSFPVSPSGGFVNFKINSLSYKSLKLKTYDGIIKDYFANAIPKDVYFEVTYQSLSGFFEVEYQDNIDDGITNSRKSWSGLKVEDRVQKAMVPLYAASDALTPEDCSVTLNYITILADLSNYFFIIYFNNSPPTGTTLTVNALSPITIKTLKRFGVTGGAEELDTNVRYLAYYDGTDLMVCDNTFSAYKPFGANEGINLTNDGGSLRALMSYVNATNGNDFFAFAAGSSSVAWPNGQVRIYPPTATYTGGALSTWNGTVNRVLELPSNTAGTYPSGKLITNDNFEDDFAPAQYQTLTNAATVSFLVRNGFYAELDTATATTRTINFDPNGLTGNDVSFAKGSVYLNVNVGVTCAITFHFDGSDSGVVTEVGTNPISVTGVINNAVRIDYCIRGTVHSGYNLYIDDIKTFT